MLILKDINQIIKVTQNLNVYVDPLGNSSFLNKIIKSYNIVDNLNEEDHEIENRLPQYILNILLNEENRFKA